MSDTWDAIQEVKTKHSSIKDRFLKRKQKRAELEAEITGITSSSAGTSGISNVSQQAICSEGSSSSTTSPAISRSIASIDTSRSLSPAPEKILDDEPIRYEPDVESKLLLSLLDIELDIPCDGDVLAEITCKLLGRDVKLAVIEHLLEKFAAQQLISVIPCVPVKKSRIRVTSLDVGKITDLTSEKKSGKRKKEAIDVDEPQSKQSRPTGIDVQDSIEDLLSFKTAKEKENKAMNEEILQLLSQPTTKEKILAESFRSQGGQQLKEFCPCGTIEDCERINQKKDSCKKLHFKKIIRSHTDETLGDCSFLNTCFHMDTCKYVHYEIDYPRIRKDLIKQESASAAEASSEATILFPPQWIQCDIRYFDFSTLGKCAVLMADPPWDIHMELPYGTMSDDEMRKLPVPILQDDGFIFLWVTGRAMELGRECLDLWGYKRVDELIWVKTNQLQRIIRTGRTGHWLNHGKEHCLVGLKGNPKGANRGLDCDVLVAEVRATSHKPDEIYGIIERLSPGTRKVELFGRPHNVQPNWITLGNQTEGVRLKDPDIVRRFKERYPDGNCMVPPKEPKR